uniref:SPG21 abhydrolase domain containing, maspardin n=1 Tax=Hucho hucho TaxID=62062 RepID=A0A4W5JV22_9TELE
RSPLYSLPVDLCSDFWLMPAFMLKKIVLGNFAKGPVDPKMADAIDFMVDRLESLNQGELASRLTLNCQNSYVEPHKIKDLAVTIMDVFDQSALSHEAKEEMYKLYPNARRAHLKTGGNFPYLCRSAEVNLYIQVSTSTKPRLVSEEHFLPVLSGPATVGLCP